MGDAGSFTSAIASIRSTFTPASRASGSEARKFFPVSRQFTPVGQKTSQGQQQTSSFENTPSTSSPAAFTAISASRTTSSLVYTPVNLALKQKKYFTPVTSKAGRFSEFASILGKRQGASPLVPADKQDSCVNLNTGLFSPLPSSQKRLNAFEDVAATQPEPAKSKQKVKKPYVVRGAPLTQFDPPICTSKPTLAGGKSEVLHGRTTRICAACKRVRCWKCAEEEAPSLLRVDLCGQCSARTNWSRNAHLVANEAQAWETLQDACILSMQMTQAKNRADSRKALAGTLDNMTLSFLRLGFSVFLDEAPTPELWVLYIHRRSTGHPTVSQTKNGVSKAVVYTTIEAELGAARRWCEAFEATFKVLLPRHMDDIVVKAAIRWAKDTGPVGKGKKAAIDVKQLLVMYDDLKERAIGGDKVSQDRFIAIAGIWFFMVRRSAWAKLQWDPSYLAKADFMQKVSQADIGMCLDVFKWNLDESGVRSLRVIASGEKNQAQQAHTTRFTPDDHFMDRNVATDFYDVLRAANKPKGLLLAKDSGQPWDSNDWARTFEYIARKTSMPRDTIGSTSLRRGYATAMREHGLSPDYIRMVGYWWSDAAKEYDGTARRQRLDCQKKTGGSMPSAFDRVVPQQPWAIRTVGNIHV
jgi:hypothetical protein